MPSFGEQSKLHLGTCHPDLITLMNEVVKEYDISVVFGHRSLSQQNALFRKGRKLKAGYDGSKRDHYDIVDKSKVVTYRGYDRKSKHNYYPSLAVDVIPYPSKWSSEHKIYEMAGYVKAVYQRLKKEGKISSKLVFGSDWRGLPDPAHVEIFE